MTLIADVMLASAAFAAAFYCYLLAGRLKRFTALETGMGSAIAVLSSQVDDLSIVLEKAKISADDSVSSLDTQIVRAEAVAARLEVLLASFHDLPEGGAEPDEGAEDRRLRFVRKRAERSFVRAAE